MSKRTDKAGDTKRKKRKRYQGNTDLQGEIPEIAGVPPDLVPVLLQALRSATHYFQRSTDEPQSALKENDSEVKSPRSAQSASSSVMDSIFDRMAPADEDNKQKTRRERMIQDRQSWVDAVRRKLNANSSGNCTRSVPVACFDYLWNIQQTHGRVFCRRAALWLAGTMLQKSSECRIFLTTEDDGGVLMKWAKNVAQATRHAWTSPEEAAIHVPLWQREVFLLLTLLSDDYGEYYPKLKVATQYLHQRCPSVSNVSATESNSTLIDASAQDLRRTRDLAMKFGDRQIASTEKLIRQAHNCLDTLVPRMGDSDDPRKGDCQISSVGPLEYGSDDDDDINWEDGETTLESAVMAPIDHATAVEQTLAAMESAGGVLQGGTLDISLATREEDDVDRGVVADERARTILHRAVEKLSSRHMPRMSSWVDALTKADGLAMQGQSLVVMPVESSRRRAEILQKLMDVKKRVASVLSSAKRLGISTDETRTSTGNIGMLHQQEPAVGASSSVHFGVQQERVLPPGATSRRHIDGVTLSRSNRVKIRYHSS